MFTKVAMWAVFIFLLGLFGVVLINTFGVITTTNQQDYTLVKNAVEAAMNDSIDWASYRTGFYLCTDKTGDGEGMRTFTSKDEYKVILNSDLITHEGDAITDKNAPDSKCALLMAEYKLNKDVFVESFIRRFANNVNNNKSYQVTIQEVIEYPPKVSVRIDTLNTYNSVESRTEEFNLNPDYSIRNQIDAILEEKS
ncbi:MAG: hypothetical protein IJ068_01160 [Bacilli bacterium]|nr:hypothetical protein [Bacilli bacterium]